MKVCFIAGTLGRGGAERQLLYMLQAATQSLIGVRVLSLTQGEPYETPIRELGISVEWVGEKKNRFQRLRKIIASLQKDRPDIIQSSHFYTNFYAAVAGNLLGITSIGAIRNNVKSEMHANGFFGQLHLRMPKLLIANSRSAVGTAVSEYSVRSHRLKFVPNVVMPSSAIHKNGNRNGPLKILFAGRLVAAKRPELFVELASRLTAELPGDDLRFVMAGDGPHKKEICDRLEANRIASKFSMLGEVADMSTVYGTASILVLTSSYEGTPNVVLEAMANGIPVVATNVGGISEILNDKRGLVVEVDDFEGLVAAAKRLIKDSELRLRLASNGPRYVAENHSISRLQSRLVGIYKGLNGGKLL